MEETKTLDIYPVSKGKRILTFLGDLFLHYILSVTLLQFVVFNIASKIVDYPSKLQSNLETINERMDVLYGNNLLFYDEEANKHNLDKNLDTTFDYFLKYYVTNEAEGTDPIKYYFIDIKKSNIDNLNQKYIDYGTPFFVLKDSKIILKQDYVDYFSPYFNKNDSLSQVGETYLSSFRKSVFVSLYNYMVDDINNNELTYNDLSYKELSLIIKANGNYTKVFNSINISISFVLSFLILYVLIPYLFKDRSTITSRVMKQKRIKMNNYESLNRKQYLIIILNNFFMSLTTLFFVGMIFTGAQEMFKYVFLMIVSLIAFIYLIINFIVMMVNKFNKSLGELSTNTIVIDDNSLNEIYEYKGYEK